MIIKLSRKIMILLLCGVVAFATVAATAATDTEYISLPIIMYHHISAKSGALGDYVISPDQFRSDLEYIKSQGYTAVSPKQLRDYVLGKGGLPEKPIMITFDDGYLSFYTYAFPVLQELKMQAVLSIIGTHTDKYSESDDRNVNYAHVNWEQVAEMSKSGMVDIGNHTYDLHSLGLRKGCRIKQNESEEEYRRLLTEDVTRLQEKIKAVTEVEPIVFAYPYGAHCAQGNEIINKLGFSLTLGCREKVNKIYSGSADCLKMLGRYNRPHGKSSEAFFKGILS